MMRKLVFLLFLLVLIPLNAQQFNSKKLLKLVKALNENIELIQSNRLVLNNQETKIDPYSELAMRSFLSPFWDYDFEILQPFEIAENGDLSMKIKYFPPAEEAFVYSVKGNLKDLERAVEDIYFVLEFKENTLQTTYEYMDSGKIENLNDSLIHFGIDQNNLMQTAKKTRIAVYGY